MVKVLPDPDKLSEGDIVKKLRSKLAEQRSSARTSPARIMNTLGQVANSIINKKDAEFTSTIYEDQKLKLEGRATLKQAEEIRTEIAKVLDDTDQPKTRPTGGDLFLFQVEGKLRDL